MSKPPIGDKEKCLADRKERARKLINSTLDLMAEIDEDLVKKWIWNRWPRGIGLYED